MSLIAFRNLSLRVSDSDCGYIARIIDSWLWYHVAPAWGATPVRFVFYPASQTAPVGAWTMNLFDTADQEANVLGDHFEDYHGRPLGRVFAGPILDHGGGVLDGIGSTVCGTVGHEAAEMQGNPVVNRWREMLDGKETPEELCDAAEGDDYVYTLSVSLLKGKVPNFLLPEWFNMVGQPPYDHLKLMTAPFQLRPSGYMLERDPAGTITPVWGNQMADWKRETKQLVSGRGGMMMAGRIIRSICALSGNDQIALIDALAALPVPEAPAP